MINDSNFTAYTLVSTKVSLAQVVFTYCKSSNVLRKIKRTLWGIRSAIPQKDLRGNRDLEKYPFHDSMSLGWTIT